MAKKVPLKVELIDPANRVGRMLHRATPGGELIVIDFNNYFRAEHYDSGGGGGYDEIYLQCYSPGGRRDKPDAKHLVTVRWPETPCYVFFKPAKRTVFILLAPADDWLASDTKEWTTVRDYPSQDDA